MKKIAVITFSILLFLSVISPLAVQAAEPMPYTELGAYIQDEFEKTHIPGMSVHIVDANSVLFSETYGDCKSAKFPFIIGSMSKSFTAVAIMQLVEQGKIDLSKPFSDYLQSPRKDCKTTVKQLLNHTSGISIYSTIENYTTSDSIAPYEYANVNYGLLGKIIEQVSGLNYGTYMEKNIFAPLNMQNSYTSLEAAKANGLTAGNRNYFGFMVEEEMKYPESEISGWLSLPAGYIISSAEDMGKCLGAYLNDGAGILFPESIKAMTTGNVDVQEGYQYGMGWGLDARTGDLLLTHGGNVENYTTNMQILPEQGIAVVVMFNACDYLVANGMALKLSYNITYKLLGEETANIGNTDYISSHLLIDAILLAILTLSFLPLVFLKKWCLKIKKGIRTMHVVFITLIHAILPTILLTGLAIAGNPMFVVRRFAPDIFAVLIISSAVLYLVGTYKIGYCLVRALRAQRDKRMSNFCVNKN